MRESMRLCFYLCLFFGVLFAEESEIQPYLLPENHVLAKNLKKIFRKEPKSSITIVHMRKLGFTFLLNSNKKKCLVATHPELSDFIFKFYHNPQGSVDTTEALLKRIKGANKIQKAISLYQYENFFVVPQKWLWKPPQKNKKECPPPQYILIAEKIPILNGVKNAKKWGAKKLSLSLLDALYKMLSELGLYDSLYIDNIPFTKHGKIAFVDTEHYDGWPVKFHRLLYCLSDPMKVKWNKISGTD